MCCFYQEQGHTTVAAMQSAAEGTAPARHQSHMVKVPLPAAQQQWKDMRN